MNGKTLLLVGAFASFPLISLSAAPLSWPGQVVDIRSGAPLANVEVYGGAHGRVDLTDPASSDAAGAFGVTYSAPLDLGFWTFYMLTARYTNDGWLYFEHQRKSLSPTQVQIRMVPRDCYFRGVVKDKVTGLPIEGADVAICRPGQVRQRDYSSASGEFQFRDAAYDGVYNFEEGIPADEQVPHGATAIPITDYYFSVTATGYKILDTAAQGLPITVISSATPDLHTSLTFELAPNSDPASSSGNSGLVNPYAYLQWAAQYFTAEELANPAVGAATADADADGLSNENEYAAGTHPRDADSDDDTLPDGWERAHQLNPLAADATADPDGDHFPNRLEWLYDTDPQAAASKPDVSVSVRRAIRVDFATRAGVNYQLQRSESVEGPWQEVGPVFTGDGQPVQQSFEAESGAQQFYRLSISTP